MIVHKGYGIPRTPLNECSLEDGTKIELRALFAGFMKPIMQGYVEECGL